MTNKELWSKLNELLGEEELTRRFRQWGNGVLKKELIKRSNRSADELFLKDAHEILSDLNKRTGARFTLTAEAKKRIKVIMNAGYGALDFCRVHEVMVRKWFDDPKMRDYLRPSTLWQLAKFDERLALWKERGLDSRLRGNDKDGGTATAGTCGSTAEVELIAKLMAKKWWDFGTWAEFVRWTVQLPTAEAVAKYEMPERVRKMRTAPGMVMQVLSGQSPAWAEAEYAGIKRGYLNTEKSREKQRDFNKE